MPSFLAGCEPLWQGKCSLAGTPTSKEVMELATSKHTISDALAAMLKSCLWFISTKVRQRCLVDVLLESTALRLIEVLERWTPSQYQRSAQIFLLQTAVVFRQHESDFRPIFLPLFYIHSFITRSFIHSFILKHQRPLVNVHLIPEPSHSVLLITPSPCRR